MPISKSVTSNEYVWLCKSELDTNTPLYVILIERWHLRHYQIMQLYLMRDACQPRNLIIIEYVLNTRKGSLWTMSTISKLWMNWGLIEGKHAMKNTSPTLFRQVLACMCVCMFLETMFNDSYHLCSATQLFVSCSFQSDMFIVNESCAFALSSICSKLSQNRHKNRVTTNK